MAFFAARELVKVGERNDWWLSDSFVEKYSPHVRAGGRDLLKIGENFEVGDCV